MTVGGPLKSAIERIKDEADRLALTDTGKVVRGWIDELESKAVNGVVPGKAYQSFDSNIGKKIKLGGEPGHYLKQLRDAVRAGMDESISPADQAAWQAARKQWAAMKTVEPLVAKSTTGDISPASLMGRVTADNAGKSRMAVGNGGKMGDLARVGQAFLKDAPNSGTADRLLINSALGGGLLGAQQLNFISPETALLMGGGLLGNRAVLKAANGRAMSQGGGKVIQGLSRAVKPAPGLLAAAGLPMITNAPEPAPKKKKAKRFKARED